MKTAVLAASALALALFASSGSAQARTQHGPIAKAAVHGVQTKAAAKPVKKAQKKHKKAAKKATKASLAR